MTSGWVVLLTFVPAVVGIGALWWSRHRRETVLFGAICVAGVFLMVGPHPADDPVAMGPRVAVDARARGRDGDRAKHVQGGHRRHLGLATLFGLGARRHVVAGDEPRVSEPLLGLMLAVVVVAGAIPFWSGTLYHPKDRMTSVPQYWTDAMAWLDDQPGDSQVVVPAGSDSFGLPMGSCR